MEQRQSQLMAHIRSKNIETTLFVLNYRRIIILEIRVHCKIRKFLQCTLFILILTIDIKPITKFLMAAYL